MFRTQLYMNQERHAVKIYRNGIRNVTGNFHVLDKIFSRGNFFILDVIQIHGYDIAELRSVMLIDYSLLSSFKL